LNAAVDVAKKKKTDKELFPHTKKRCYERYGIEITRNEYDQIISKIKKDIKDGQITHLYKQSLTRSIFKVRIQEKDVIICYDKSRKLIMTALPPECEDPNQNTYTTSYEVQND
jgi:hypothetical protein